MPEVSLTKIFTTFLYIGCTGFGGPAIVAYIRQRVVEEKNWLEAGVFDTGAALCQTVPGAIAMQMSAFVGWKLRGMAGAAAGFAGFGLPAFAFMLLLSIAYQAAYQNPVVTAIFAGLQAVIVAFTTNAAWLFGRNYLRSGRDIIIALSAVALFAYNVHPFVAVIGSAGLGLFIYAGHSRPAGRTDDETVKPVWIGYAVVSGLVAVFLTGLYLLSGNLFNLSILMMKIDLFAFGGGFSSVPIMYHEIVDVRGLLSGPAFLNGIALGQFTPGPIVITATFVGYMLYGFPGAVAATVGIFLPSFIMVTALAPYFERLRQSAAFNGMVRGIMCSFVGLLVVVSYRFAVLVPWDLGRLALFVLALGGLLSEIEMYWIIIGGIVLSLLLF